jgi:serine/threonine protein phosphatase PrpC
MAMSWGNQFPGFTHSNSHQSGVAMWGRYDLPRKIEVEYYHSTDLCLRKSATFWGFAFTFRGISFFRLVKYFFWDTERWSQLHCVKVGDSRYNWVKSKAFKLLSWDPYYLYIYV